MVNNVVLIGRLTSQPEIKNANGFAFCKFNLAVNRNFKNKNTGEYEADFINCTAFNQTAEVLQKFVNKGGLIAIQGRIQTSNFQAENGERVYSTEVVANSITFLEKKNENNLEIKESFNNENNIIEDDDLPF